MGDVLTVLGIVLVVVAIAAGVCLIVSTVWTMRSTHRRFHRLLDEIEDDYRKLVRGEDDDDG